MKRILSILLILVLCLGVFVACQPTEAEKPAATLDDAKAYLAGMYKDSANNLTNDYDLVGKAIVNGVTFTVTWKADIAEITIKESDKKDFWTVDLPDANATEKAYVLTATIADADGNTTTVTLSRILPVYEKVAGIVNNPVAETAYKLFFTQKNLAKTLFLLAEDTGKFIKTTNDPKAAADFYVEAADNGVKIYTLVGNAKKYLVASTELKEDGKVSKAITYGDNGSVFTYNKDINAWYTVVDNIKYCMGTYSTYDTVSISEDTYYTPENTGVEQFPVEFILKADGEAMAPTEGPADPTELTSIADVLAIAATKEHNSYTAEKYLVKGTITEIANTVYGNFYIEDEAGNSIYIYGLYNNDGSVRFDAMNPQPKVGDVITVMSIVGQYNDAPQLKNAWLMKLEAAECTSHVYDNDCDASCNTCGAERDVEGHDYDNDCDADCNVCGAERKVPEHVYDDDCDADCEVCGATRDVEGHDYDNDCDAKCNICDTDRTPPHKVTAACDTKCDLCGETVTATAEHDFSAKCDYDCNVCNTTRDAVCEDTDNDGICNHCNETIDESKISRKNVAEEKDNLTISTVAHGKYEETLPTTGKTYSDVTISWRVEGNAATIEEGKAICTATGTANVEFKLIATLTSGDITDTKDFTVKVTPHTYDNDCKDVDCNVEECTATRTATEHSYDNHLDTECNNCISGTRDATECVDADKNGECDSCGGVVETFPKENTPYKLYLYQKNYNKILYFKGEMDGYYFATTEDIAEAVDLYFEKVTGGYYIYFETAGTKNYLYVENTGSHINVKYGQSPAVFTYDETLNTMVIEVATVGTKEGGTMYLGTYSTYKTFSASTVDKAPTSFVGGYIEAADAATCTHEYATPCAPKCHLCGTANANPVHEYDNACDAACNECNQNRTVGDHNYAGGACTICGAAEATGGAIQSVATPQANIEYLLISPAGAGDLAFNGTLTSGRINAVVDHTAAVKVTLEAGAGANEFYITFMNNGTKTYLSVNPNASTKTAAFVFSTTKDDNCVWVIDTTTKSIQSKTFTGRGIGTQVTSTYTNFSTYSYSSNGQSPDYAWAWFFK